MSVQVHLCVHRLARATDPHNGCRCVLGCSLLLELAWKEAAAAGKLEEAGEGIHSAVHPRYLLYLAEEQFDVIVSD
jgi:hypothetical protein